MGKVRLVNYGRSIIRSSYGGWIPWTIMFNPYRVKANIHFIEVKIDLLRLPLHDTLGVPFQINPKLQISNTKQETGWPRILFVWIL
jgi:hypothetical protein